jgi:MIP family channel proteins
MAQTFEREAAAEFFGTLVLIAFGAGVVAQTVLSHNAAGSSLSINIGWGLGVMLGIYSAGGVSGAHLNPAVTLALALRRGFPWRKVPLFVIAQVAGAFAGAALVWLTYYDALAAFDGGVRQISGALGTAGIFATYPQAFLSPVGGFIDQVVGTALLMAGVLAVTDQRNTAPPPWLAALSSADSSSPSAWRSGSTRATRSTPRAISVRVLLTACRGLGPGSLHRGSRMGLGAGQSRPA